MRSWQILLATTALAVGTSQAAEPMLASKLDLTLNAARHMPSVCKQGDIERFAGRSLAQVFGDEWPVQPEPEPGSERIAAQMTKWVRDRSRTRSAPVQSGIAVIAVLVDASGAPRQAEVLCATSSGYDTTARRLAIRSEYKPAVINGRNTTSVVVHVMKFAGGGN